jgi:hypothetical protein
MTIDDPAGTITVPVSSSASSALSGCGSGSLADLAESSFISVLPLTVTVAPLLHFVKDSAGLFISAVNGSGWLATLVSMPPSDSQMISVVPALNTAPAVLAVITCFATVLLRWSSVSFAPAIASAVPMPSAQSAAADSISSVLLLIAPNRFNILLLLLVMIDCPGPRLPAAKVHRSLDTLWSETPQRPALPSCFCCVLLPLSRSGWANPPPESRGAALLRAAGRQGRLPTAFPLLRCDACAAASRRSSLFAHLWALSLAHPLTDPAWSGCLGPKRRFLGLSVRRPCSS